jgi:RNA polymerase sigma-70 factor (ECF subfamily)
VAIDSARLKRAEPLDPELLASRLQLQTDGSGSDQLGDRARLREALATLPMEQRRALFLAAYSGRTAREIAELEDVPLGTAKTRIRTAMLRLREELEVAGER